MSYKLTLEKQIAELNARLHVHPYVQQLALHSRVELIHKLFKCGREDVEGMACEFLSEYPEYMDEFIAHYFSHETLMPIPEDLSKDRALRLEYESLMEELGSLMDESYEKE